MESAYEKFGKVWTWQTLADPMTRLERAKKKVRFMIEQLEDFEKEIDSEIWKEHSK